MRGTFLVYIRKERAELWTANDGIGNKHFKPKDRARGFSRSCKLSCEKACEAELLAQAEGSKLRLGFLPTNRRIRTGQPRASQFLESDEYPVMRMLRKDCHKLFDASELWRRRRRVPTEFRMHFATGV